MTTTEGTRRPPGRPRLDPNEANPMNKEELRERLRAIGMRYEDFFRATGTRRQYLTNWERGRWPIWILSWLALAEASPELARILGAKHLKKKTSPKGPRNERFVKLRPEIAPGPRHMGDGR